MRYHASASIRPEIGPLQIHWRNTINRPTPDRWVQLAWGVRVRVLDSESRAPGRAQLISTRATVCYPSLPHIMILSPISTWPGELAHDPGPKLEVITNACGLSHPLYSKRCVPLVLRYSQSCRPRPGLLEKERQMHYTENSASKGNFGAPFLLRC